MVVLGVVCAAVAALVASARRPAPRQAIAFRPQSVVLRGRAARGAGVAARGLRPDAARLAARRGGGGAGDAPTEWPREWNGRPLRPLALGSVEARFAAQFPGRIERLTDEESVLVWREVRTPTRMLHPATDCYRGLGYRVVDARLERDAAGPALALLRRRARRPPAAGLRAHRGRARPRLHRRLVLVLGGAARPLDRALAGDHGGDAAREPDMSPRELAAARPCALAAASPATRFVRAVALALAALLGIVLAAGAVLLATALYALRAAPGDWSVRVAVGPLGMSLSVPALVRVATHPLGIRLLDGRSVATRARHAARPRRRDADVADRALRALP